MGNSAGLMERCIKVIGRMASSMDEVYTEGLMVKSEKENGMMVGKSNGLMNERQVGRYGGDKSRGKEKMNKDEGINNRRGGRDIHIFKKLCV